jgi:hypothetical protein
MLATGAYVNKKYPDVLIVADVYRMGSLLDAFGIYSNYRKADYESVRIGAEGFISPTQMMFYQDRYFVRLQATGTTELMRDVFLDCARLISARLPALMSRPKELEVFSIPAILPKSERYLAQSLLGYAFFRKGLIADANDAGEAMRVIVVFETSVEGARKAFEEYQSYLKQEGQDVQVSGTPDKMVLVSVDPLYDGVYMEQSGRHLIGAIKVKKRDAARHVIEALWRKMDSSGMR